MDEETKQLVFSGTSSLTVTGLTHIKRPVTSGTERNIIDVGACTLVTNTLEIDASVGAYTNSHKSLLIISSGTVTVNSDLFVRQAGWTTFVRFTDDDVINISGVINGSYNGGGSVKITSAAEGSLTGGPTSGTVHYTGTVNHAVWGQPYHNLCVSGITGAIKTLNQLNDATPPSVSSNGRMYRSHRHT